MKDYIEVGQLVTYKPHHSTGRSSGVIVSYHKQFNEYVYTIEDSVSKRRSDYYNDQIRIADMPNIAELLKI